MTPGERARAISAELDRWWAEDVEAHPWPEPAALAIEAAIGEAELDDNLILAGELRAEHSAALENDRDAYETANDARNARWEAHRAEFIAGLDSE